MLVMFVVAVTEVNFGVPTVIRSGLGGLEIYEP